MNVTHRSIDTATVQALLSIMRPLHRSWTDEHCSQGFHELQDRVIQTTGLERSSDGCNAVSLHSPVVFDLSELPDSDDDDDLRLVATALALAFGMPCRVVQRWPLWHDIPVDPDRPAHRFGGVGLNPLHMDMVNATRPPTAIGFLCLHPDPLGGGATLLTNAADVFDQLTTEERALLTKHAIHEGQFFDYHGIGEPMERFPVLDSGLLRFTAKAEPADIDVELHAIYDKLRSIADATATGIQLRPRQLLLFSNLHYLHGRRPLGPNQENLASSERRCVNQVYLIQCRRCRST